jgi:hypothetical protein
VVVTDAVDNTLDETGGVDPPAVEPDEDELPHAAPASSTTVMLATSTGSTRDMAEPPSPSDETIHTTAIGNSMQKRV